MLSSFVLSQIFAGLLFLFAVSSYQFRERKYVLLLLFLAQICNSVHFFLLGAIVGGMVVGFSALRFLISIWSSNRFWKYFFIITAIGIGVYFYENLYDFLPVAAAIFATVGAFASSDKRMRQYFIGGTLATSLYNVVLLSPVAIVASIFLLYSTVHGYYKFHIRKSSNIFPLVGE